MGQVVAAERGDRGAQVRGRGRPRPMVLRRRGRRRPERCRRTPRSGARSPSRGRWRARAARGRRRRCRRPRPGRSRGQLGPDDGLGGGAAGEQELVEQDAGAGAGFAPGHPQAGQVPRARGAVGVAGGHEQALLAAPQVQQVRGLSAQQARAKGALSLPSRWRRWIAAPSASPRARARSPGKLPRVPDTGTTRRPAWSSSSCRAGSSLPARRNTRSPARNEAAAIAASGATRARRRSPRLTVGEGPVGPHDRGGRGVLLASGVAHGGQLDTRLEITDADLPRDAGGDLKIAGQSPRP